MAGSAQEHRTQPGGTGFLCGFLEKESHNVFKKKWQERYFYYHSPEQRLYYFERRPDTEAANFLKHAKGSIALERRKVIRKEAESLDFEIKDCTANKSYPLRAKNEEEKHRWLTELSQVGFGAPPPGVPLGADKGSRTGSGAAFDSPYGASDNSITKLSGVALSTIARESIEPGLGFRSEGCALTQSPFANLARVAAPQDNAGSHLSSFAVTSPAELSTLVEQTVLHGVSLDWGDVTACSPGAPASFDYHPLSVIFGIVAWETSAVCTSLLNVADFEFSDDAKRCMFDGAPSDKFIARFGDMCVRSVGRSALLKIVVIANVAASLDQFRIHAHCSLAAYIKGDTAELDPRFNVESCPSYSIRVKAYGVALAAPIPLTLASLRPLYLDFKRASERASLPLPITIVNWTYFGLKRTVKAHALDLACELEDQAGKIREIGDLDKFLATAADVIEGIQDTGDCVRMCEHVLDLANHSAMGLNSSMIFRLGFAMRKRLACQAPEQFHRLLSFVHPTLADMILSLNKSGRERTYFTMRTRASPGARFYIRTMVPQTLVTKDGDDPGERGHIFFQTLDGGKTLIVRARALAKEAFYLCNDFFGGVKSMTTENPGESGQFRFCPSENAPTGELWFSVTALSKPGAVLWHETNPLINNLVSRGERSADHDEHAQIVIEPLAPNSHAAGIAGASRFDARERPRSGSLDVFRAAAAAAPERPAVELIEYAGVRAGGVPTVVTVMRRYSDTEEVLRKCLDILKEIVPGACTPGDSAQFGSSINVNDVMDVLGPQSACAALFPVECQRIVRELCAPASDADAHGASADEWDAFICHSGVNKAFAKLLHEKLESSAVSTFFDSAVLAGRSVGSLEAFRDFVRKSQVVIVLVTSFLASTAWAMVELEEAIDRYKNAQRRSIVPVFESDDLHPDLINSVTPEGLVEHVANRLTNAAEKANWMQLSPDEQRRRASLLKTLSDIGGVVWDKRTNTQEHIANEVVSAVRGILSR